jgi:hypothetical protein
MVRKGVSGEDRKAKREEASMTPFVVDGALHEESLSRIAAVGAELRPAITTILESIAGARPRPTRLSRAVGLDKSLASRLVRAVRATSDLDLMHLVPSPAGLRILAESAARMADRASIANLMTAIGRFEELIDAEPGGRAAIDAQLSESSVLALEKRERIAKQASFKSMSFLLGYFCDVLTTTLFLVPSANGKRVDGIELQRRIGLRRMRPSTPLPLLSVAMDREDAATENDIWLDTINGDARTSGPTGFLLPEFSTKPIPEFDIVRDGEMTTLVLAPDPTVNAPSQLTSAFRIRNGWPVEPESRLQSLRGYVLHIPCRRLVRDVFIAESLFKGATPRVSFVLPGSRAAMRPPGHEGARHFTEVGLTATIERLPSGPLAHSMPDVTNHGAAVRHVLERTGHAMTAFRGWRCAITYPVPLIEMIWWLEHPGHAGS